MKTTPLVVVLLLAGCASVPVPSVVDADESMVASCRYLGDVDGVSGWGGAAASAGIAQAKNDARIVAARRGATHIVWTSTSGAWASNASGRAYACR